MDPDISLRHPTGHHNPPAEKATVKRPEPIKVTWQGDRVIPSKGHTVLEEPLHWKKPRRIFVCSMGDLFHSDVPIDRIAAIFGIMAFSQNHTFQILTKRPDQMAEFFSRYHDGEYSRNVHWWRNEACYALPDGATSGIRTRPEPKTLPLPNIWLGVTVCNGDELGKIDTLRSIPAAVRFISFEPLLGDVGNLNLEGIHWVIVGGETGPGARPMHSDWARSIRDQCVSADVPFFFKRWGAKEGRLLDGKIWEQYPG